MARRYRKFPSELVEFERQLIADQQRIYGDKRWIVASSELGSAQSGATRLMDLGASSAVAMGAFGPETPWDDSSPAHPITLIGPESAAPDNMLETLRRTQEAIAAVDSTVQDRIDAWDPDAQARAIVDFPLGEHPVAGRVTFGARRASWDRFDDKLAVEEVWNAAGIDTMESGVVALGDERRLAATHDQLATPLGTVWAADNTKGWHGGAAGTAWVQSREAIAALRQRWAADHEAVRIQPFAEGVPCSIHAMVLADRTLAFRPTEMVVLRDRAASSLVYCRSATYWDPPRVDRARMRAAAIAVGNELRRSGDFRGVFTLDGVMTGDGFRPTEINPRWGAALPMRLPTQGDEDVSIFFVHLAVVAGVYDDLDGDLFERWVLFRLDQHRSGSCFVAVDERPIEPRTLRLDVRGETVDDAEGDGDVAVTVEWTSGGFGGGGVLRFGFGAAMPIGPSVAPAVARAIEAAGEHWSIAVPRLEPAIDLDNPTGKLGRVHIGS